MKANELMIDDWVEVVLNDHLKYVQIAENYKSSILTKESEFESEEVSLDNIKPIPLTPEILEKNGFTRYGQVYANLQQWVGRFGDKRKLLVQDIRTGKWGMNDVWIDYVHELQHVLNLCGIEKTIEL